MALSGGMDSTCLLLRLLAEGHAVTALGIDYGQRHRRELELAQRNVELLQKHGHAVTYNLVDLKSAMSSLDSSLTDHDAAMPEGHYAEEQMKQTVVPNRNAIFSSLLFATALSLSKQHNGHARIALGVHSGDHAIYPDCRPAFYTAIEHAFKVGNWDAEHVNFDLPYLHTDKAGILRDGLSSCDALGLDFDAVLSNTLTSYAPDRDGRSLGTTGRTWNGFWRSTKSAVWTQFHTSVRGLRCLNTPLPFSASMRRVNSDHETEEEWRALLPPLVYHVTREAGTERPYTGALLNETRKGTYRCVCCGRVLFTSVSKFHSGCGGPHSTPKPMRRTSCASRTARMAWYEPKSGVQNAMPTWGMSSTTATAARRERYCINSVCLTFEEDEA